MQRLRIIAAAAAVLFLATPITTTSAAPVSALGGAATALTPDVGATLEPVSYRCWWDPYRGKVCAFVRPRIHSYNFYYGPPRRHWGYGGWRRYW